MTRDIIVGAGGLVIGLLVGFWGANSLNRPDALSSTQSDMQQMALNQAMGHNGQPTSGLQPDIGEVLATAEQQPGDFVTQMKAGDLYAQIGKFDKAIEFYQKGLALKPDDIQANLVLANAYFDAGQFENAGKTYEHILSIDPKNAAARTDLATTFIERANPDIERAITEFKTVLETNPTNEPALFNLSVAYSKKGDQESAKQTLAALETANPTSELIGKLRQRISAN
jgi:tetratricopeptide (TPR) repeat protein